MDLSHPLRSLIPSLDSATLEVLAGTESGLGTSQIRRVAGRGSWTGHQTVLDKMVKHGLVLAEPTNNGFTYRLNRTHLLAPAVLAAVGLRSELLARLRTAVRSLDPQPLHSSIFGSFAREAASPSSDIDLFLLMPEGYDADQERWDTQLQHLEDLVLGWTGNRLEVLVLTPSGLEAAVDAGETVLDSLREEAITVHGAALDAVLATRDPR